MKPRTHSTAPKAETAVLVAVTYKRNYQSSMPLGTHKEYLDELESLVKTAGAQTLKRFVQKLEHPNPKTFIGSGKIEEIQEYCAAYEPDMIVFDDELSPTQIRNLESQFKNLKIIDRSSLILHIFAKNAQTAQAKMQVELAQSQYLLPRLTRMWTHLQKQKGGIGMKGPGEKEIETDRRVIRNQIARLKEKLKAIEKQGLVQRKNRSGHKRFALVGYTNAGKSTLMNLLSGEELLAEDKLFATLDATVRKVYINHSDPLVPGSTILLSDTVGFIRKLPTLLIESFKSTLAEAQEADVLIHVADFSHPELEEHLLIVQQTLHDIGMDQKPVILVFNKIDLYLENYEKQRDPLFDPPLTLEGLKKMWIAKEKKPVIFISATEKSNIEELKDTLLEKINSGAYN